MRNGGGAIAAATVGRVSCASIDSMFDRRIAPSIALTSCDDRSAAMQR